MLLIAQDLQLRGRIVSGKEPVEFANVILQTKDSIFISGGITDQRGRFNMNNLQKGNYQLRISGSWSHSRTKTMPRYPLMNLIPTDWQEEAARQSNDGGSSQGFGYTARALLERRVTSNWFVGTAIDIQQAKDYAPSHFLLYVRYSAAGWQGDMDLPPQPLIPYADW